MNEDEIIANLIKKSISMRGNLLHQISILELGINVYMGDYFCGKDQDKNVDIQMLIFGDDRMNLGAKQQVFFAIASTKDIGWYNSYKSLRIPPPKKKAYTMNADLVWVIEQRNIFAHRVLNVGSFRNLEKMKEGHIRFVRMKNELEALTYSEADFQLLINTVTGLAAFIHQRIISTYSPSNSVGYVSSESSRGE